MLDMIWKVHQLSWLPVLVNLHMTASKNIRTKRRSGKQILCAEFLFWFFGFLFLIPSRPAWSDGSVAFRLRRRSSKKAPSLRLSDSLTNEALRSRHSGGHNATYAIEEGSISPTFRISYGRVASKRRATENTMLSITPVVFNLLEILFVSNSQCWWMC
jgi:hypothetical protein